MSWSWGRICRQSVFISSAHHLIQHLAGFSSQLTFCYYWASTCFLCMRPASFYALLGEFSFMMLTLIIYSDLLNHHATHHHTRCPLCWPAGFWFYRKLDVRASLHLSRVENIPLECAHSHLILRLRLKLEWTMACNRVDQIISRECTRGCGGLRARSEWDRVQILRFCKEKLACMRFSCR